MPDKNHAVREGDEEGFPDEPLPEEDIEEKSQKAEKEARLAGAKPIALALALLVIGILIGQIALPSVGIGLVSMPSADTGTGEKVDLEALQEKVEAYINDSVLGPQGFEGKVLSIEPYDEDFYNVSIQILQGDQELATQDIFMTRSGNAISGTVLFLDEPSDAFETEPEMQAEPEPTNVAKSDTPKVELFIMSYCPYGLQAQKALLPAWQLLGDKADISVKFVDYAMHGWKEIEENSVQYCIEKEQPGKYLDYATCFTQTGDTEACRQSVGIDEEKLSACIGAADQEFGITESFEDESSWLSGRYPQYNIHRSLNDQYGVQGSPTWVINGTALSVSRSPESVKQAICDAFNVEPEECIQTLSTAQASVGIGGGTASAGATEAECS